MIVLIAYPQTCGVLIWWFIYSFTTLQIFLLPNGWVEGPANFETIFYLVQDLFDT